MDYKSGNHLFLPFKIDSLIARRAVKMEEWKVIPEFPDYQISSLGRVKSTRLNKERILTPHSDGRDGYLQYHFGSGKSKFRIHREVARAFCPNPENKTEIDHINRDKTDNRACNLRWATRSENSLNRQHLTPRSGHKYIHQNPYGHFKVHIRQMKKTIFNKTFLTLEEAIVERDKIIASHPYSS